MGVKQKVGDYKNMLVGSSSITPKEQLGVAGGIFGNCMGQDSVHTYGDKFKRDFMGISSPMMLAMDNVSTILSFLVPPVAGAWYDTPSKGKRSHIRTAIMLTPIPFAISSLLLFIVPSNSVVFNFVWAFFFYLVFSISDTFYDIALSALSLKLCSNPKDRKNFFTFTSLASTLGSMLPGWIIPIIVGTTDDHDRQKWLYFIIALGFGILAIASMYAPYLTINEKADMMRQEVAAREMAAKKREHEGRGKRNIQWNRETLSAILHNRPFVILQISMFFDLVRQITYKALPYLYEDVFANYSMKAIIDMISGILSYVGLFAVPFVGTKVSARTMVSGGYFYTAFFYVIISLFNINPTKGANGNKLWIKSIRKFRWIIGVLIGMAGMPNAAQSAARKIITADSTDYMEWYSYKNFGNAVRSDGMLTAANNIVTKFIELCKVNLYNILFSLVKYKSKDLKSNVPTVQSNSTLKGLYMIISLCGLIGNLFAGITFLFDNYTGTRKERIFAELTEMRAEHKKLVDELENA